MFLHGLSVGVMHRQVMPGKDGSLPWHVASIAHYHDADADAYFLTPMDPA
jgi:hypothetical protein